MTNILALMRIKGAGVKPIKKGKYKKIKWGPTLHGMKKHAHSGIAINQSVSQQRTRDYNRETDLWNESKKKRKGYMCDNVINLFGYLCK